MYILYKEGFEDPPPPPKKNPGGGGGEKMDRCDIERKEKTQGAERLG